MNLGVIALVEGNVIILLVCVRVEPDISVMLVIKWLFSVNSSIYYLYIVLLITLELFCYS